MSDYVEHILEAITRIETYVGAFDSAAFIESTLVQDAVVRNFEIIGEAANNINAVDSDFARRHPELELRAAYEMRNALAHGYYTVNLLTVWNAIKNDLPPLKKHAADALRQLPQPDE